MFVIFDHEYVVSILVRMSGISGSETRYQGVTVNQKLGM